MTDGQTLCTFRREQALSTLAESQKMLDSGFSVRSIVNRAYYAMFYMVLALFLRKGIQVSTSKHSGIMSTFDKEFVHPGLIDRSYSKDLHRMFDRRLEFDYKDYADPAMIDPHEAVTCAREFIAALDALCNQD